MARDYEALLAFVGSRASAAFVWGVNDCVTFAAGAVKATTGRELALPAWSGERAARRLLRERGGLQAAVDALLPRVPVAKAARGDIGLIATGTGPALVVVMGEHVVGPRPSGLAFVTRGRLLCAWSADLA